MKVKAYPSITNKKKIVDLSDFISDYLQTVWADGQLETVERSVSSIADALGRTIHALVELDVIKVEDAEYMTGCKIGVAGQEPPR